MVGYSGIPVQGLIFKLAKLNLLGGTQIEDEKSSTDGTGHHSYHGWM
jgi:hypothetical protein